MMIACGGAFVIGGGVLGWVTAGWAAGLIIAVCASLGTWIALRFNTKEFPARW